jgi:hypothetical protein
VPHECHPGEALRDPAGGVVAEGAVVAIEGDDAASVADGEGEALEMATTAGGAVAHDLARLHGELAQAGVGHHRHMAAARRGDDVGHRPCPPRKSRAAARSSADVARRRSS